MEKMGNFDLYDRSCVLLISIFVLCCSVGFNFLYTFRIIRYALLVFLLVAAILLRHTIISVIKGLKER